MILLSGADVVLPDRLLAGATLVLDGERIAEIRDHSQQQSDADVHIDLRDRYIVPGFIDVHVHGIEGTDTLDGGGAIATMAERLPRYGTTAFCPTSIACDPAFGLPALPVRRAARASFPHISKVISSIPSTKGRSLRPASVIPARLRAEPPKARRRAPKPGPAQTFSTRSPQRVPTSAS